MKKRALSWLGHLLRLDPQTPARQALNKFIRKRRRPIGRPKETWLSVIRKSLILNELNIDYSSDEKMIKDLVTLCEDRKNWRNFVKNIKLL